MAEKAVGTPGDAEIGLMHDIPRTERISEQQRGRPMEPRQQFREHPVEFRRFGPGTEIRSSSALTARR
ncbi:hypothetical protein [Kitasatospora sp. NPDC093806]|uniref:hypothetical protein n=1 Tax=Kitasatospora sp. NPDC093806 TaxID=3155075 RepID=UPI00343E3504